MARGYGANLIEDEDGVIRPRVPQMIDARAPMADPSRNNPMAAPSLTPKAIWDELFRNRLTGNNPLAATASVPAPVSSFNSGLKAPSTSLATLANGGMNHQQRWTSATDNVAAGQQNVMKYVQPGTLTMTRFAGPTTAPKANDSAFSPDNYRRFSWSSAFGS